jgi:signal transduction histidine kinase
MADRSPNLHDNVTPAPAVSSADALDAAQARANDIAQQFVNASNATHAERAAMVQDLKAAAAELDRLERGGA